MYDDSPLANHVRKGAAQTRKSRLPRDLRSERDSGGCPITGQVVRRLIERTFPDGTNLDRKGIDFPPRWPPDLFAIAAALVTRTGRYVPLTGAISESDLRSLTQHYGLFRFEEQENCDLPAKQAGQLRALWKNILNDRAKDFSKVSDRCIASALALLRVADGACEGVGRPTHKYPLAKLIRSEHNRLRTSRRGRPAGRFPAPIRTLCNQVPVDDLRVLPKVKTPALGQTVRSLSRHLALIQANEVEAAWIFGGDDSSDSTISSRLNLLLVPFPYRVAKSCFRSNTKRTRAPDCPNDFHFEITPTWLNAPSKSGKFMKFIDGLITESESRGRPVDGIVFPELAISADMAEVLASDLIYHHPRLRLLIAGVNGGNGGARRSPKLNSCNVYVFDEGQTHLFWAQSKHHQWRLDAGQIKRYRLKNFLNPKFSWWESFQITRDCIFCSLPGGFTFTTLICEDIARVEPVLPIIRALGPNLVIALLMDGGQYRYRWGPECARALNSDPGAAVLTFTSLALANLAITKPTKGKKPPIAFWQDSKRNQEITLRRGAHAVLLPLSVSPGAQPDVRLCGPPYSVRCPAPPSWAVTPLNSPLPKLRYMTA